MFCGNSSPSCFFRLAPSTLLLIPVGTGLLVSEKVGFPVPAERGAGLCISHGPSPASPNSWGRVMDLGCDNLSLGVGHGGPRGTADGSLWSCVACPSACVAVWRTRTAPRRGARRGKAPACSRRAGRHCSAAEAH